jgi:tricorn protease interacting factor F2/3
MKINRYELHLDIDDSEHRYEGTERIHITAEEEKLLLNAVDLRIKKVSVNGKAADFSLHPAKGELSVETTLHGETAVDLEFSGDIGQTLTGFYLA